MKEIKLNTRKGNKGNPLGLVALVDDEDFERVNQYKWYLHKHPQGKIYTYHSHSVPGFKKRVNLKMHRFILGITDPKTLVDHKNGSGLDNQKNNLRLANASQNNANKYKRKYKYLGVICRENKYWTAKLTKNKKTYYLGCFKTEIEAAKAYNKGAIKHHGEFANLNIIPE